MSALLRCRARSVPLIKGVRFFASLSPTQPGVVKPSSAEIKKHQLDARNLEKAVQHVHQDGLVVIEDVIPHEHLDFLNKKMVEDAHTLQARGDKGPFNYNKGNIQQDAPPVAKFFSPSIFISKSCLSRDGNEITNMCVKTQSQRRLHLLS